jgi:acyl carrier protein
MPASESKLKQIMADVFGVDSNSIDEHASVDTIKKWDSFNHMKLVLALEEQFNVTFQTEQTVEMLSYSLVKIALSEHGVVFDQ